MTLAAWAPRCTDHHHFAGRLDVYLYIRVFAMNGVFLVAIRWQRYATRRTLERLAGYSRGTRVDSALGISPLRYTREQGSQV